MKERNLMRGWQKPQQAAIEKEARMGKEKFVMVVKKAGQSRGERCDERNLRGKGGGLAGYKGGSAVFNIRGWSRMGQPT